jgi:transposase-like protein
VPGHDGGGPTSICNTFWLASKRDWEARRRDVKPIYTAVNTAARAALGHSPKPGAAATGAIIRLWENATEEFIPFLDYDIGIRQVLCSTNSIEPLNARYRRAVKARPDVYGRCRGCPLRCSSRVAAAMRFCRSFGSGAVV